MPVVELMENELDVAEQRRLTAEHGRRVRPTFFKLVVSGRQVGDRRTEAGSCRLRSEDGCTGWSLVSRIGGGLQLLPAEQITFLKGVARQSPQLFCAIALLD